METLEQTIMQVERFIRKVAQKFPAPESDDETSQMTDIHVRVSQDSGELLAFDDDDNEITRCVAVLMFQFDQLPAKDRILLLFLPGGRFMRRSP